MIINIDHKFFQHRSDSGHIRYDTTFFLSSPCEAGGWGRWMYRYGTNQQKHPNDDERNGTLPTVENLEPSTKFNRFKLSQGNSSENMPRFFLLQSGTVARRERSWRFYSQKSKQISSKELSPNATQIEIATIFR